MTVTWKSRFKTRREAAIKIIERIRSINNKLVEEVDLISEEMVKAAILLNEFWSEGIEEAWKTYSVDKNVT